MAKIEALFSELDKAVEQLERVAEQLKRYRQAVLKAAFEGKLTADWRAQQQAAGTLPSAEDLLEQIQIERAARYEQQLADWKQAVKDWEAAGGKASGLKKPRKPAKPKDLPPLTAKKIADLPDLPEGWGWVRVEWLLSFEGKPMTTGPFGTLMKKADHARAGVPVLGIENIDQGTFVPGNKIFVTPDKAAHLWLHPTQMKMPPPMPPYSAPNAKKPFAGFANWLNQTCRRRKRAPRPCSTNTRPARRRTTRFARPSKHSKAQCSPSPPVPTRKWGYPPLLP